MVINPIILRSNKKMQLEMLAILASYELVLKKLTQEDVVKSKGMEISYEEIEKAYHKLNGIYHKTFVTVNIPQIYCDTRHFIVGFVDEDFIDLKYTVEDIMKKAPEPQIRDAKNIIFKICENGIIAESKDNGRIMYFDLDDAAELVSEEQFELPSGNIFFKNGLTNDYRRGNILYLKSYQCRLATYRKGYKCQENADKRALFKPCFAYLNHMEWGIVCDNEVDAACEALRLERTYISPEDKKILYHPEQDMRNCVSDYEKYLMGEYTSLGLLRAVLQNIAYNPFLMIRYGLCELSKELGVLVTPFRLDKEGFIVNDYGVRYSELAEYYIRGQLCRKELVNQKYIKSITDLSAYSENLPQSLNE